MPRPTTNNMLLLLDRITIAINESKGRRRRRWIKVATDCGRPAAPRALAAAAAAASPAYVRFVCCANRRLRLSHGSNGARFRPLVGVRSLGRGSASRSSRSFCLADGSKRGGCQDRAECMAYPGDQLDVRPEVITP